MAACNEHPLADAVDTVKAETAQLKEHELLADAVDIVKAQTAQLKETGLSKLTFTVGVLNVVASTFVIARWPEYYWAYHGVKGTVLLAVALARHLAKRTAFYLLDLCWVVNALLCAFSLFALADAFTGTVRSGILRFAILPSGQLANTQTHPPGQQTHRATEILVPDQPTPNRFNSACTRGVCVRT